VFRITAAFALLFTVTSVLAQTLTHTPLPGNVELYDTVEVTLNVQNPKANNPFASVSVSATFTRDGGKPIVVRGFCDAADGSVYRVRFLPTEPGVYKYELTTNTGSNQVVYSGEVTVTEGKRKGRVLVDRKYPHHFVWEYDGTHFFWNGTTTYWLLGVQDEKKIEAAIDRLAKLKVNRIRVALNARTKDGSRWYEPQVTNTKEFLFRIDPWLAKNQDDVTKPEFDTSRFNLSMWQKLDKLVNHARKKDMVVSILFHLDGADQGVDPFNGGKKKGEGYTDYQAEETYYRYGVARLAGFSNVMWDITNEWHLFRDEKWVNHFGALIQKEDHAKHLISVHGRGDFPFYQSPWAGFAMYQVWDENGSYKFLRKARKLAEQVGRPMPQVNEEYGYEDHYPGPWGGGKKKPARSADNRRRLAWEMTMAGGYQTTGERADEPGQGGWITGLGNDQMIMLNGYARMVEFFTSFDWWKCDPADGLADNGAMVLAEKNKRYVMYAPKGDKVRVKVPEGEWQVRTFNPRTGEWGKKQNEKADDSGLVIRLADAEDWAAVIDRE
jgi:hypothetical protein